MKKPQPAFCFCAAVSVFAALPVSAWAQKPAKTVPKPPVKMAPAANLPTAEAVLDKYVEATGGKAAYTKITSTSTKATMKLTAQGLSGTVEASAKAPNKIYVSQTFTAIGKMEQGYDGTTGWSKDPFSGLRTLEGAELTQFKTQAVFNSPLRWRDEYAKTEMLGIRPVNNKPAYALRLTSKTGKTDVQYYDTKSGLQVKSESVQESPQGKLPVETYYDDYRTVDGIKVPFKVRALVAGNELISTVTEYKNNVPLDDTLFAKPAAAPVAPVVAPVAPAEPVAPAAPAALATP